MPQLGAWHPSAREPMPTSAQPKTGPEHDSFPHLLRPPVDEVVCGLMFEGIPELDPFEFGVYWESRRADYPGRTLQPAVLDGFAFQLGPVPPSRAWLISKDDGELLQQLQYDRFYMNWRRRKEDYPHFNDSPTGEGLKTIAMREFEKFASFCESRPAIKRRPHLNRIELSKIDVFTRGKQWATIDELSDIIPITKTLASVRQSDRIQIGISERQQFDDGWLAVQINSNVDAAGNLLGVRLESRMSRTISTASTAGAVLAEVNATLNQVFFALVPHATRHFGTKG